jgi:toxin-antitoxin system PIN domain toxin
VKIVDANVLLYAVNSDAEQHGAARSWLDDAIAGRETLGFAWAVVLAFIRLSTHPAVFPRPLSPEDAVATLEGWLAQPTTMVIEPTARHLGVVAGMLAEAGTAGNLVADAHLAAMAVEHGAELVSFDADFRRFAGVRWSRPGEAVTR